jgi:NTP pyrophosphatase (non-canonical NTP hydrolase)
MQIKEFRKFIKKENKRLKKKFGLENEEKRILAKMVKLTEEVGELADEVLGFSSMQRKEKLDKRNKEDLLDEFADVIICTFLLAESMGVDIEKGLKTKIKKIEKRYKK